MRTELTDGHGVDLVGTELTDGHGVDLVGTELIQWTPS